MKKQPEVTEKTKKAFMNAFCELYCQKPIEKISVQEIANKAGYNRSSFYQHFCDIYELLDYLESDVMDFFLQKGMESVQEITSLHEEKGFYLSALFGDYGSNHFLERLKSNIPFEAHKLGVPKDNPIAPYLMEFHLSTVLSMLRLWYRRQRDITPEEFLDLTLRLYTGGILATLNANQN